MVIKVKNLIKKFEEKVVLDNFNLELKENDILGLIGPNGCGKTTLISCILELIHYDSGNILVFGENSIKNKYDIKRKIGFVPQEIAVFDELTVRENIDFFCSLYVSNKNERKNLVNYAIDFVDLKKFEKFIPKKLSGGLLRRLNIACGIVNKPKLLILDEPTAGLDPRGRDEILSEIKSIHENRKMTVILVSHSMEDVAKIAERIIVFDKGKVFLDGEPREIFRNEDKLLGVGLGIPQITSLMRTLKKRGLDINEDAITVEEAKESLKKYLRGASNV